jgi:hypothetical protein
MVKLALLVAFLYCALCENTFLGLYVLRSPWRADPVGRMLVYVSACIAGIMDLAVLSLWWRPTPWLFLAGYAAFGAALTYRIVLLLRAQRKRHPAGL